MSDASMNTAGAGIDLSQFTQVFFEEAGENLESMERQLLDIDLEKADDEELNAIFRCAHSVKGGAATFGFTDIAELTHDMETLLDQLRRREVAPDPAMVDVLLQSGDVLKAQLARHQSGGEGDAIDATALRDRIAALLHRAGAPRPRPAAQPPSSPAQSQQPSAPVEMPAAGRVLELALGPRAAADVVQGVVELFAEVQGLGTLEPLGDAADAEGMRRFKVVTDSSDDDILDLCTFHVAREQVRLTPFAPVDASAPAPVVAEPVAAAPVAATPAGDASFGFFDDAPGVPGGAAPARESTPSAAVAQPSAAPASKPSATAEATTLRVSVEKIDQLINLVGELVITQAMLAQTSAKVDPALYQQMAAGLEELNRNTRDLQESVMSIRMIPMSVVFSRFPRMLRDLAGKLGKKVNFVTEGEATELDKGLVEKITDPLTHLVRNSCDHGIELPEERVARGKPETGTITLAASHQGGSIVIEVRDDGKGLSRTKLIAKARERGIDAPDSLEDAEVWNLIFAPGFSTAEQVTDVSGRGVGMDVVKKNIASLGGSVEIVSVEGAGMSVRVRLPLTLAIMDSMSVGMGDECYILPLSAIVESFQVGERAMKTVGTAGRVVQVRDEYLPVIELAKVFAVPPCGERKPGDIMVVVESDGARVALQVDALLGQQQVVVKNLEANYRKVAYVSGATIMGDGHVALILDVGALVRSIRGERPSRVH